MAIMDVFLYTTVLFAIELAKEWNLIGAAGLRQYDMYDWLILFVGVWAVTGVTIHAYYNNRLGKVLEGDPAKTDTQQQQPKVDI